jgi:phospholipase/carboxylesterase
MSNSDISRPHVYQPGTNNRVLLLLHGTGADEYDLLQLGKAIDPLASLLSPRGMYLEAGMNRFFERYPDGTFNESSIDLAADELAGFIAAAAEKYSLADKEFVAVGFSNGANTAASLLLRHPAALSAAVLFGSTRPYRVTPQTDLSGKRVWLANGDQDSYAPVVVSEGWVSDLQKLGAEVSWLRHPGGHQISPVHVKQISEELNQ